MAKYNPVLCGKIREDKKNWDNYWHLNITQYHETTLFILGKQWDDQESQVFMTYKKIPLTFNKMAPLINHLVGEQRQNTPQLQVTPEEGVPEETASVREALVKDISLSTDAKVVYQTAFQQAAVGGYSAMLVRNDYEDDYSFNQTIGVKAVKDPTQCFWDISADDPCKVMGMFSGLSTNMSRKMFRALYGRKIEMSIGTASNDQTIQGFWDSNSITIIDYFKRKYKRVMIYELSNGRIVEDAELNALEKMTVEVDGKLTDMLIDNGMPVAIVNKREVPRYTIKHYKIAGDYILEETVFPTKTLLPLVYVDQNSYYNKSGEQIARPFLKDATDAQRYLNYLGTQMAYLVKVTRYDQFLMSKANAKSPDTRQMWTDPLVIQGALYYDESPNGHKPEQLRPPELPQSLNIQYLRAIQDIHESSGMYQTQLGEKGNEISGAAIDARTKRGNISTYIPFDALNRAIACVGQIIDEMIPQIYDTERDMMLNMPDTGLENVRLNQPQDEYGILTKNDMTKGRFKIRLQPGPSYENQKVEYLEALKMVLQADPQLFTLIADLYVENLPLANNLQLRNRLRTLVPPEIIEAGKTGKPMPPKQDKQPSPEQMAMQLKQMDLQLKQQALQMEGQRKQQELALKQADLQVKMRENDQAARSEYQRLETERLEAAAMLQEQILRYQAEMQKISSDLNINHANNMVKILTHQPKERKVEQKELEL